MTQKEVIIGGLKHYTRVLLSPILIVIYIFTGRFNRLHRLIWIINNQYINLWKTIVVNLSSFPFKDAIKFPIIIKENPIFLNKGKFEIVDGSVKTGILIIDAISWRSTRRTRFENHGTVRLQGNGIRIFKGTMILVKESGILTIMDKCTIGENDILYCEYDMKIGRRTSLAFGTNVTDTNSHFMVSLDTGEIKSPYRRVEIGDFNWLGNNTSVKPGTITPHHTIVASSYSVLTKDYTKSIKPYSIIGGSPASILMENVARIYDTRLEIELFRRINNGESINISIDNPNSATDSLL